MLWIMQCFALQFMGRTNHKFPVHATQMQLKSTVSSSGKMQNELNSVYFFGGGIRELGFGLLGKVHSRDF